MTDVKPIDPNTQVLNDAADSRSRVQRQAQDAARGTDTREPRPSQHQGEADSVQISRDAQDLQRFQERVDREPSFNEVRVQAIKTAIENGQYPVDSRRLAERFLELEGLLDQ